MLRIKFEFYGAFREFAKEIEVEASGENLGDGLCALAELNPELYARIMNTETAIFVVNGKRVDRNSRIRDGDVVKVFSSVLGG